MKTNSFIKSLSIVGASTLLALSTVDAKPDKDKDKKHSTSEKSEKHADQGNGKSDKKDQRPGKDDKDDKHDGRDSKDKPDRGPDKKNQAERKDERRDDRTDNKHRGEFKGRFEDRDRDHVVTYFSEYKGRHHGLPPGLARKWESGKRLPPGWRDRVVSGYVIQDDWYPSFEPVPYDWFPGITVVPNTRLYWYGDRIVRVYEPSREVVDVVIIPTIHIDL